MLGMANEIESVVSYQSIITHDGDEKYIIAKVVDHSTKQQKILLVSHALKYHSMIAREFEEKLAHDETVTVLGGGILTIDRSSKSIKTYGQSGGYGPPKVDIVKQVLQNSPGYEEFQLDITVTKYIRD